MNRARGSIIISGKLHQIFLKLPGHGNKERDMRKIFGFLIGTVVGGLVGSTIALLLAPESGNELRAQLRVRGENFFNEVRHAADERKIELRQRLEYMREPRVE
jgi:hypothetical protein